MKTSFTINGQVSIILEPETKLEKAALEEMYDSGIKGATFSLIATPSKGLDPPKDKYIITARG